MDEIIYENHLNGLMMSHLDTRVIGKREFLLLKDFHVKWGQFHYVAEKGEVINFASIPIPFRNLFDVIGPSRYAAAMHDSMYERKFATREHCDFMFGLVLENTTVDGRTPAISSIKSDIYWAAVRLGGWTRGNW